MRPFVKLIHGFLAHMSQLSKRHVDRFSSAQLIRVPNTQTHRQTHTHTTLRATSVAIGRICAFRFQQEEEEEEEYSFIKSLTERNETH